MIILALNQLIISNPPNFLIVYHAKCSEVNYKIVRKFVVLQLPLPKNSESCLQNRQNLGIIVWINCGIMPPEVKRNNT